MSHTLAAVFTAAATESEHAGTHAESTLPMSPVAFGLAALVIWATLLAVTFAFRSVGTRHD